MRRFLFITAVLLFAILFGWPVYNTGILLIRREKVTVRAGDALLAATIHSPRWGKGPFAAMVVVHGSGRVRGDQLRSDVRRLVPEGMVMLTYDKRGVGDSTGAFQEAGLAPARLELLADDAIACLRVLRAHPRVDPKRIGFFGASQAGWIIPIALDRRII